MEDLGVTESVEHAKQWGAPIVVAKSKNDALRIFVDYTPCSTTRLCVMTPKLKEGLAKLVYARVFSQPNATTLFCEVSPALASRELTTLIALVGRHMLRTLQGIPDQLCEMGDTFW